MRSCKGGQYWSILTEPRKMAMMLRRSFKSKDIAEILGIEHRRVRGWCEKRPPLLIPRVVSPGRGTAREFDVAGLMEAALLLKYQEQFGEKTPLVYLVPARRKLAEKYEAALRGEVEIPPHLLAMTILFPEHAAPGIVDLVVSEGERDFVAVRPGEAPIRVSEFLKNLEDFGDAVVVMVNLRDILVKLRKRLLEYEG